MRQEDLYERLTHDLAGLDKEARSATLRARIETMFLGQVPSSMMWYNRSMDEDDPEWQKHKHVIARTGAAGGDMYADQKDKRRLSMFEGALAHLCINMWSDPGDLILDPFSGRITRMALAVKNGRKYRGYDTSPVAVQLNREWAVANNATDVEMIGTSVLDSPPAPDSADMIFTCPPYWNSEHYAGEGNTSSEWGVEGNFDYCDFILEMGAILALASKALKPECYMVVVVKDMFLHRQMLSLHTDVVRIATAAGLIQHDCIAKKVSSLRDIFHQDVVTIRRSAQTHEYVLVFKRPGRLRKTKDPYRAYTVEHAADKSKALEYAANALRSLNIDPTYIVPKIPYTRTW